nr:MAG: internal scaffolding protein [Microvirus sp.]
MAKQIKYSPRSAYLDTYHSPGLDCSADPGRTKQSFKQECDINNILKGYQKTGAIAHLNQHEPQYGEVSGDTFQESMQIVQEAQQLFNELPSSIRERFQNKPNQFLDFVQNNENHDELIKLGLAHPAKKKPPNPVTGESDDEISTEIEEKPKK